MTTQHPTTPFPRAPLVLSIAGTDPTGGAGIQADSKTIHGLGGYACTVITSVIAQNTQGVQRVAPMAGDMVEAQLGSVESDTPPRAIKLGALGNAASVRAIAVWLARQSVPVVCDPVLHASSGTELIEPQALETFRRDILPRVAVLTPNLPEAAALLNTSLHAAHDLQRAAADLRALGPRAVLLKGGHREGGLCQDFWLDEQGGQWINSPRLDVKHTHGGGCTLSSALATGLALGLAPLDAAVLAKAYVNQGLRLGGGIGKGRGPLAHLGWPRSPQDMPWIVSDLSGSSDASDASERLRFPDPGPLGLYPIVDRAAWMERLLPLGVDLIQLRIKDLWGCELEREVEHGVALAKRHGARLFVNDHWQLALRFGAYGVHLGQDDLGGVDLRTLHAAGLRLGLSTHGLAEMARALAVLPSYLAIGTLFESPSKSFVHKPLGLDFFKKLRPLVPVPVVAIGGITLERAADVRAAGADGLAVISDLTRADDLSARVAAWAAS